MAHSRESAGTRDRLIELVNQVAEHISDWDPDATVVLAITAGVVFLVPMLQAIWWAVR